MPVPFLLTGDAIGRHLAQLRRSGNENGQDQAAQFAPKTREGAACKVRCAENQQIGQAPPGAYAKCIEACKDVERLSR